MPTANFIKEDVKKIGQNIEEQTCYTKWWVKITKRTPTSNGILNNASKKEITYIDIVWTNNQRRFSSYSCVQPIKATSSE
jgi:hypothetical protein